jgi:hypothetical protein
MLGAGLLSAMSLGCVGAVGDPAASGSAGTGGGTTGSAGTTATTGGAGQNGTTGGAGTGVGGPLDVGVSTATRLNRTQFNNTVHDLLGTTANPADSFPADETALGFDTIAGTLRVQPERSEKYLSASADLINELFAKPATDATWKRYFTCDYATAGSTCQRTILKAFATRAWRRPVDDAELNPYVTLVGAGPTPKDGMIAAMRAVIVSANFLYRFERDPNIDDTKAHRLNGYELASRLSYFLWGTMPDDTLFSAAGAGTLMDDAGLKTQVSRMLSDQTRVQVLIDTFGAQWLGVNHMLQVTPDATAFPMFNEPVRAAMISEAKRFLLDFMGNNKAIPQMLSADFTYANSALASFYGLPAVQGTALVRVPTTGTNRSAGLLTLGAFLAGESNPTRTSPVKRGLYVLERLLCSAPPPPPGNVNLNIDQGSGLEKLPIRTRLQMHQMKGSGCAACHVVMDSIGLGLENYDAVGRYRASDEFGPINATGMLPASGGAQSFDGAQQLSTVLAGRAELVPCIVEKMLTFGVGRSFESDHSIRDAVAASAGNGTATLRGALEAVVMSDAFRNRRAALATEVKP